MMLFWSGALALSILLYVLLDGFDLGVGMLFALAPDERGRRQMLASIQPVWDGNETWLICAATILFGAFPMVFALLLAAFYVPLIAMLGGLILRGMAFEFRERAGSVRWIWDAGFIGGSWVAAFVQGAAVGALVKGLPIAHGVYVGGAFGWLSPFSVLCGVGLCIGYAMIGCCWIAGKGASDVRALAFLLLPGLIIALLVFLACVFVDALSLDLAVMRRWTDRPVLYVFPLVGVVAFAVLARAVQRRQANRLFAPAALIFVAAFGTLALSFLPFIIPWSVTIAQAIAPDASLWFMFWGIGLVFMPATLIFTVIIYFVFGRNSPRADDL